MRNGTVIAVTSGKGGTGKTSVTAGVGTALSMVGRTVLCIDADLSLRNLDLCLGLSDRVVLDLSDVLAGSCTVEQAVVSHPDRPGLNLLAAPYRMSTAELERDALSDLLREARTRYDFILIDSPAGLDIGFYVAAASADGAIVVATPTAASLRDAQRVAQELRAMDKASVFLVVNQIRRRLLRRMSLTVDDAMDATGLPLLGLIPEDADVPLYNHQGRLITAPRRRGAGAAYQHIARRLTGEQTGLPRRL